MKMTPQRLEIFRQISNSNNHFSAEDVFNRVKEKLPTISLDTIYLNLRMFENFGLLSRVYLEPGRSLFDHNLSHHHHLICSECKTVKDIDFPGLDDLVIPETIRKWGTVHKKELKMEGVCSKCARKGK